MPNTIILPSGWKTTKLKQLFDHLTRKNTEGNSNVLTISAQYGLISQEDFFNKSVASEDLSGYYLLRRGDFAYNKSYSAGYNFGAFKQLTRYDSGVVSPLYICFTPNANNKCPEFYVQVFESMLLDREIKAFAQEGARNHGLLNIAVDDFFSMPIPLPPLPEQRAIAEILTAQDNLIALKQRLIDAKKHQKRWLMQNLLTGKMRLPGFCGEWENARLGDVAKVSNGKDHKDLADGKIPVYGSGGIMRFVDTAIYSKKSVLIPRKGSLRNLFFVETPFWTVDTIFYTKIRENRALPQFLFFSLSLRHLENLSEASGVPSLTQGILDKLKIPLPPLPEQTVIAEVLTTAGREIELLTRELEQQKLIKKYLMQQLLTGRKRVRV
ncbi:MAG: restriction endonuclease subunit S [Christensenellaceae bacterium]|jgi:type I restriction enzyme S subunit|nr:restriction endonuclease subunit S [Christensenellaceae bacterium]